MTIEKVEQTRMLEKVVVEGDLSKLAPAERLIYYRQICESLGLNPLTRPFDYIVLSGRLTLYCNRQGTDQLRKIHGVSITKLEREQIGDVYVVTAYARDKEGRTDSSVGAVNTAGLRGDALANAYMRAETKAKRRVTLSLVGLGWLDESEVETIATAQPVTVDMETGEIVEPPAKTESPLVNEARAKVEEMKRGPAKSRQANTADTCPACGESDFRYDKDGNLVCDHCGAALPTASYRAEEIKGRILKLWPRLTAAQRQEFNSDLNNRYPYAVQGGKLQIALLKPEDQDNLAEILALWETQKRDEEEEVEL
jgi:ribosomal protein L37AE/L43A